MARQLRNAVADYWGLAPRRCPVCSYEGRFVPAGRPTRIDARCPRCAALERHRLLALVAREQALFSGREVLHFAPERAVTALIQAGGPSRYATSNYGDATTLDLDLEAIDQPDDSWDVVVASHVLEHVDDTKALAELHRITRPGGTVVLMVPIIEGWATTHEDQRITSEAGRLLHFGQHDHVRYYGADLRDRIRDAGFDLEEHTATEPDVHTFALLRGEKVFLCTPT